MNFIAHRSLVEVDPCVNVGLAPKDEDLCMRLGRALNAVEKFDWRNLHTACVNGSFGSAEAINLQIKELSRFLVLKAITDEDVSCVLAPSKLVERIWRLLILFSRDYRYLCDNILSEDVENRFIDHDPLDNSKESRALRYYNTVSLYCKIFKECPPLQVWPHPEPLKRKKTEHLALLNSSSLLLSSTPPKTCRDSSCAPPKRLRFSPEIEVKVYTKDTASSSPPVEVNYLKPIVLQLTPTRSPATPFSFETPTPPSTPQPSAFLLACQRVLRTAQEQKNQSESPAVVTPGSTPFTSRLTESPPTLLPVSVFSSAGEVASPLTPEKGSPPRQQITLRFLDVDNGNEKFDMNTKFGTSFKIILASFKKKRSVFAYRSVKFNGVEIDENKTPNDLGMVSHDRIEVFGSIAAMTASNQANTVVTGLSLA